MISEENKYFYSALNNIQNLKYEEAINDLLKVIEIDNDNLDAYHNLARVYYEMQNFDKAIETYNKSIEIYPHDSDAYYYRAEVYIQQKNYDKAIEDLEKSISKNEAYSDAYYLMSVAYRKNKKYKKAIKYLKKTLEFNSEDYIAYYDLYKLYTFLYNHSREENEEIKNKYLLKANKCLKKSADLGYEKAIEELNNNTNNQ